MLQLVISAPRNAIPSPVLCSLRSLGFPAQARALSYAGRAALYRAALRSPAFDVNRRLIEEFSGTDDCVIVWKHVPLWRGSHFRCMLENWYALTALPATPPDSPQLQAKHEQALVVTAGRGVAAGPRVVMVRRARHFDPALCDDQEAVVFTSFARLSVRVPLCVLSSFLRTLSNAWCTSGRFGLAQDCRACGTPRGDTLRHILWCPSFEPLLTFFPLLPNLFIRGDGLQRLCFWQGSPFPHEVIVSIALVFDVYNKAYHDFEHCRINTLLLLWHAEARLQQLVRRDHRLGAIVGRGPAL